MIRRPPRSTLSSSSAASDVYKRQLQKAAREAREARDQLQAAAVLREGQARRVQCWWRGCRARESAQHARGVRAETARRAVCQAGQRVQAVMRGMEARKRAAAMEARSGSVDEFEYPSVLEETIIPFRPHKDTFSSSSKKIVFSLMQISTVLKQCGLKVYVEGQTLHREKHTMAQGRAAAVRSELVGLGVPAHQLRVLACAKAQCDSARVVFKVVQEIRLKTPILFAAGSAELPQAERCSVAMRSVARVLEEHPSLSLRVEGHADTEEANAHMARQLSKARAQAACRFLVECAGVDGRRLESVGQAWDCLHGRGEERNRRIEFHIISHDE
eukprot:TRINITY_DN13682_c0_g1_i4.p1 TRINITY_DN13682_c0_g1~~TRINITY_DN13682_c0_g1_i4.p1  ORF type:complete len:330 (-),score=83.07 TRINITY_DN13682_c0_g1_i4:296-1285(-)